MHIKPKCSPENFCLARKEGSIIWTHHQSLRTVPQFSADLCSSQADLEGLSKIKKQSWKLSLSYLLTISNALTDNIHHQYFYGP